jgi:hypothetical protein
LEFDDEGCLKKGGPESVSTSKEALFEDSGTLLETELLGSETDAIFIFFCFLFLYSTTAIAVIIAAGRVSWCSIRRSG